MILIKSDHPYAYKRGYWGMIVGECTVKNRPCFDIVWPDGDVDVWPVIDPTANYQFREVEEPLDSKRGT